MSFGFRVNYSRMRTCLLSNCYSQKYRTHQSIQISFDEGRTWPAEYRVLLDEGAGNGYSTLSRLDKNHVGIVYEGSQAHRVFEKLSLDELLWRGK